MAPVVLARSAAGQLVVRRTFLEFVLDSPCVIEARVQFRARTDTALLDAHTGLSDDDTELESCSPLHHCTESEVSGSVKMEESFCGAGTWRCEPEEQDLQTDEGGSWAGEADEEDLGMASEMMELPAEVEKHTLEMLRGLPAAAAAAVDAALRAAGVEPGQPAASSIALADLYAKNDTTDYDRSSEGSLQPMKQGKGGKPMMAGSNKPRTTVMLRNLPNNYTRSMLAEMMDQEGFAGKYDFVYLPVDFKSKAGLGYAFVNLVDEEHVSSFWNTFDGYRRWVLPSSKVCHISWSGPHQGLRAHVARYKNSPIMHQSVPDEYKPALFVNGERALFPPATRPLKAPRHR